VIAVHDLKNLRTQRQCMLPSGSTEAPRGVDRSSWRAPFARTTGRSAISHVIMTPYIIIEYFEAEITARLELKTDKSQIGTCALVPV